jgi:hypothetical protein
MAMEIASGQPVFLSLSFMRWRSECIVSFLSVMTGSEAFHEHSRAVIPSTLLCVLRKERCLRIFALGYFSRALIASGESGTERCELLVLSVLQGVGDMIKTFFVSVTVFDPQACYL